jgi:hypothetical protein
MVLRLRISNSSQLYECALEQRIEPSDMHGTILFSQILRPGGEVTFYRILMMGDFVQCPRTENGSI